MSSIRKKRISQITRKTQRAEEIPLDESVVDVGGDTEAATSLQSGEKMVEDRPTEPAAGRNPTPEITPSPVMQPVRSVNRRRG